MCGSRLLLALLTESADLGASSRHSSERQSHREFELERSVMELQSERIFRSADDIRAHENELRQNAANSGTAQAAEVNTSSLERIAEEEEYRGYRRPRITTSEIHDDRP